MHEALDPDSDLFCPRCGYNLRSIASPECPECGLLVDRLTISRSVIPWTHRAHLGRTRAFLRTVWLVSRRARKLAGDVDRPTSLAGAQHFRWIVVAIASLPLIIAAILTRIAMGNSPGPNFGVLTWANRLGETSFLTDLGMCAFTGAMLWPVPLIAILMFILSLSGVGSYFFHPRSLSIDRQNRAIALSYYACAPLTLMFVPVILGLAAVLMARWDLNSNRQGFRIFALLICLTCAGFPAVLALLWFATLRVYRDSVRRSFRRTLVVAALLPLAWVTLALLMLVFFPAMCGFVRLMIESYRGD